MIPKNWNKVPLENFVHYLKYKDEKPETLEERFNLLYKRICAILDCTIEEAKALNVGEQAKINKLMNTPLPERLMIQFKHKGISYRPIKHAKNLSGARYASIKDVAKRGVDDNLHHILFLVCTPVRFGFRKRFPFIGWKDYEFEAQDMGDRIKDFKTLPMEVVNPVAIFFLTLSKKLSDLLSDYSHNEIQKMIAKMSALQKDLEEDMDGLQ